MANGQIMPNVGSLHASKSLVLLLTLLGLKPSKDKKPLASGGILNALHQPQVVQMLLNSRPQVVSLPDV